MDKRSQDILDSMFPYGYTIFYAKPEGSLHFNIYNPKGIKVLNDWGIFHLKALEEGLPRARWDEGDEDSKQNPEHPEF